MEQFVIPVSEAMIGMVVANSITTPYGTTLLPSKSIIEERHLKLFKIWGVDSVSIHRREEAQDSSMQDLTPSLLEQGLRRLRRHVQWNPRIPIEHNLFKTAIKILARTISIEEQRNRAR